MFIDVHAHAMSEAFFEGLCRRPAIGLSAERDGKGGFVVQRQCDRAGFPGSVDRNVHDTGARLESLKRRGVDLQLVGPTPRFLCWPGGALDVEGARVLNAQTASVVDEGEGLLGGMASVAFGEPELAARELRKAVDSYGFRGAMIPASAGGVPLDDAQLEPVFSVMEELGLLVFMHPARIDYSPRLEKYQAYTVVRFPYETTVSVTRLIFTGFLERHPGLKLVLAHGGGNLVFLRGRLDAAYNAGGWEADSTTHESISARPSHYLDQLYFDTNVLSPESLDFLLSVMGTGRVLFGSDYPFDIGDPEGALAMPAIERLSCEARAQVLGRNAEMLLP